MPRSHALARSRNRCRRRRGWRGSGRSRTGTWGRSSWALLLHAARLPCQRPQGPGQPEAMTPGRVRAGFRGARQAAGTPASAAKTTRPAPADPRAPRTSTATPFTVVSGTSKTCTWTAVKKNGYGYAFSIYGPDGFVRSFAGAVVGVSTTTGQIPQVTGTPVTGSAPSLQLTLADDGTTAVTYTLTVNDYAGTTQP
jgi:phospholipase C